MSKSVARTKAAPRRQALAIDLIPTISVVVPVVEVLVDGVALKAVRIVVDNSFLAIHVCKEKSASGYRGRED